MTALESSEVPDARPCDGGTALLKAGIMEGDRGVLCIVR